MDSRHFRDKEMTAGEIILAKSDGTTLKKHLRDVSEVARKFAVGVGLNAEIAALGAKFHDIGKSSVQFQKSLSQRMPPGYVFRHEIASLLFLSLVPKEYRSKVIEMVVAHHKSLSKDSRGRGFLDLEDTMEDSFATHAKDWDKWSGDALEILGDLGIEKRNVSLNEAKDSYQEVYDYCDKLSLGCSEWKGLLMAADHYSSALGEDATELLGKLFVKPDLTYYGSRRNGLYPLSMIETSDERPHTMVTAPTGAGKTDFLLRRCRGRVFYVLPFQASINAMYDRIKADLGNTDAMVTLRHSTSSLKMEDDDIESSVLQDAIGSSVKVLTPHQMASIVFGMKGYEAMVVDLKGNDVILDEIHTYSGITQSIVWRIVEILVKIGCRVHIGTATMPTCLYEKLYEILGGKKNVYKVELDSKTLDSFNRHIVHKLKEVEDVDSVIGKAVEEGKKMLVVCNQVKRAQELYERIKDKYEDVPMMLIHSRFKRGHRAAKEDELRNKYDRQKEACIVVSTQVVEVSLDISFDVMVTECAPLDALIQRFGRINRRRTAESIGVYKDVYVIAPGSEVKDARPYDQEVIQRSFDELPNGDVLQEQELQEKLDRVYPEIIIGNIDYSGVAFKNGEWCIHKLRHNDKSALLDILDIDNVVCITESDKAIYKESKGRERLTMEIPARRNAVVHNGLERVEGMSNVYVVPDSAYNEEIGLMADKLTPNEYGQYEIL